MKRAWLGVTLLSASWLVGLGFYETPNWLAWTLLVVPGAALLSGAVRWMPPRPVALAAAAALVPAAIVAPWPAQAAALGTILGLLLRLAPAPRRWPGQLGSGLVVAGVVLLVQAAALWGYEAFTARFPDLPEPLAGLLGWVGQLAGLDLARNGTDLAVFSMRQVHRVGATWGLLLDPLSWCLLAGGAAWLLLKARDVPGASPLRPVLCFVAVVLAWLPVRAVLMVAVYMYRALLTGYDDPLDVLPGQFWDRWLHMLLLAGPLLLAWRFVGREPQPKAQPAAEPLALLPEWKRWAPAGLALLAAAAFVAAEGWDPAGVPKGGRVLVDDYHSLQPWPRKTFDTTRTDKPFDTEWYGHDSAYNHFSVYDYCDRHFTMSRQLTPLDANALAGVDVLMLKVPSAPYTPAEIDLVKRFVERGGGLLLLGEHTAVYGSGAYLNRLAEIFGFRFRYDCAFGIDSVFEQDYTPPLLPHPIVQYMPTMDFATSCTIDPGANGRVAVRDTGLINLTADYHASNFYPQAKHRPEMRYGPFVQLWTVRYGQGRVAAFTDSTIFSNFCVFEPGKSEILLGMVNWLNRRDTLGEPRGYLIVLGLLLAAATVLLGRAWRADLLLLMAAATLGWGVAVPAVRAVNRASVPAPQPIRHMVRVGIDRTICDANLPRNGFIAGRRTDYGQFERCIPRVGYFPFRAAGRELDKASMILFLDPNLSVPEGFADRMKRYVADGGKLLVFDSPENAKSSANRLLAPFRMETRRPYVPLGGQVSLPGDWPAPVVKGSLEVKGGTPFAKIKDSPVGAWKKHGRGKVWVIGFGSRFTDSQMGYIGDVTPSGELVPVFRMAYKLLRSVAEDTPTTAPVEPPRAPRAATTRPAVPTPRTTPTPRAPAGPKTPAPKPKRPPSTRPASTGPAATQPARR